MSDLRHDLAVERAAYECLAEDYEFVKAQVARVRDLHEQVTVEGTALGTTCAHCGKISPCPTIAALDDVEPGVYLLNGQATGSLDHPWITLPAPAGGRSQPWNIADDQ